MERYVEAWEQNGVETVVEMLAEDATFAMPPLASWFGGREEIGMFLDGWPMSGAGAGARSARRERAARACVLRVGRGRADYLPFALNVLTFRGDLIGDVVAFVARKIRPSAHPLLRTLGGRGHDPHG